MAREDNDLVTEILEADSGINDESLSPADA